MKKTQCDKCKKNCENFETGKDSVKSILEKNDSKIYDLIIFFEYLSPNTSSYLSSKLDLETSEQVLNEMFKKGFEFGKNYCFFVKSISDDDLKKYGLYDGNFKSYCKRFVCSVAPGDKKNNLTALMRHIRNSIAHGRYSIIKGHNYYRFFFEDKNAKENVTFRMVINHANLRKWKSILIETQKSKIR